MSTNENIKAYRIKTGLSQDELAKKVGYGDRSSIAKIENGSVDLSESKIAAFAKVFGISPAELMGYVNAETPSADVSEERLDEELIERLCRLTPDELAKVDAFVQGLLAAH